MGGGARMFFQYGEKEIIYLKQKDKRLAEVIDKIGKIEREVDSDLFSSVVHHIIGQQISTKAQATIWQRMQDNLGVVNADTVLAAEFVKLFNKRKRTELFAVNSNRFAFFKMNCDICRLVWCFFRSNSEFKEAVVKILRLICRVLKVKTFVA